MSGYGSSRLDKVGCFEGFSSGSQVLSLQQAEVFGAEAPQRTEVRPPDASTEPCATKPALLVGRTPSSAPDALVRLLLTTEPHQEEPRIRARLQPGP